MSEDMKLLRSQEKYTDMEPENMQRWIEEKFSRDY